LKSSLKTKVSIADYAIRSYNCLHDAKAASKMKVGSIQPGISSERKCETWQIDTCFVEIIKDMLKKGRCFSEHRQ